MKTLTARIGWALAILVCLAVAFWAGRLTMRARPVEPTQSASDTAVASHVTVGRSLHYAVTISSPQIPVVTNGLAGIVTRVEAEPVVNEGSVLYRVAEQPVTAVLGDIPFFRDLAPGLQGHDVAQLERFLASKGLLATADDLFDELTFEALQAWQRSIHAAPTGSAPKGSFVAFAELPAKVFPVGEFLRPGKQLVGGEDVILRSAQQPSFELVLDPDQARLIPDTAPVKMALRGKSIEGVTSTREVHAGTVHIMITSSAGGPPCQTDCADFVDADTLSLLAEVVVTPSASGVGVPVSAVHIKPDGTTAVFVAEGGAWIDRPVAVKATANGIALVDGIQEGTTVSLRQTGATPTGSSLSTPR